MPPIPKFLSGTSFIVVTKNSCGTFIISEDTSVNLLINFSFCSSDKVPLSIESGTLSDEQKEKLIKRLTEVSSEIMKVPQEFFVTTIKEVPDKNFGIGGKTIDKVKAEYMQSHN